MSPSIPIEDINDKISKDEQENSIKRDEFIFQLIQKRLDEEISRIDRLDSKANNLVGFVSLITGLLLGSTTFNLSSFTEYNHIYLSLYFGGIVLLLFSIVFSLIASRIQNWTIAPDIPVLIKEYTNKSYYDVIRTVGASIAVAIDEIEKQINKKLNFIKYAWVSQISGLSVIFIFVVLITLL